MLGLWRGGFFEHAAFYGGTALRMFHGLQRFSEDLDFTRLDDDGTTRLEPHLPQVAAELEAWGFIFESESKDLLQGRFAKIDFRQAAAEVRPFVRDPRELELWSREFFDELAARLGGL